MYLLIALRKKRWEFNQDLTDKTAVRSGEYLLFRCICKRRSSGYVFTVRSSPHTHQETNKERAILLDYLNISSGEHNFLYWKTRRRNTQIKRVSNMSDEYDDPDSHFFDNLNGQKITAVITLGSDSDKESLYLFAGRQLCRMETSNKEWLPFCQLKDITDWVDCSIEPPLTTTSKPTLDTLTIVAIIVSLILCIVFVVILVFIYRTFKAYKRTEN